MTKDLVRASRQSIEKKVLEDRDGTRHPNAYTKEFRRECYQDQVKADKEREERQKEASMFKDYNELQESMKAGPLPVYGKDGRVRQANQGKYEWRYEESNDKTCVLFEIRIPKYLDTGKVNVDL